MNNAEILNPSYELIQKIDPNELPKIISSHVNGLKTLSIKVDDALAKAKGASNRVSESEYSTTFHIFGDSKKNFETLTHGQSEIAKATLALSEGLQVAYENQEQLAEISKYLFALGCSNIAANRSVVRQLEMELAGASPGKLRAFAKSELYSVIRQLKAQEDVLEKMERLKENAKSLHEDLERNTDELQNFKLEHDAVGTRVSLLEKSLSEERLKQIQAHEGVQEILEHLKEIARTVHEKLERNADDLQNLKFEYDADTARIDLLEKSFFAIEGRFISSEKRITFAYIVGCLGIAFGVASMYFHL